MTTETPKVLPIENMYGENSYGADGAIVCPICQFDYVHLADPTEADASDFLQDSFFNAPVAVIPMYGECGARWTVVYGSHKGTMVAAITVQRSCEAAKREAEAKQILEEFITEMKAVDPDDDDSLHLLTMFTCGLADVEKKLNALDFTVVRCVNEQLQ